MTATRLTNRAVIRLTPLEAGEDVAAFLQGLVTNDAAGALPCYAGLLTPQGKTLFDFLIWPGENGDLLVDCEAEAAEDLVRRLSLYRLRRKVGIAIDPSLAVHWRAGSDADGIADPRLSALGQRWLVPVSDKGASDGEDSADARWLQHRLALGVAEGRAELGDILWLETNAAELNGVSFTKGCYVGQENTARMNWRQKINRRLMVVPLAASEEKRRKADFPALGLAIDHLRSENIDPAQAPEWLRASLSPAD
ncbi:YgfZ/GcvT domain-containing protein [Qipengyuania marisflavi]|uniref:Folate-binding protein n=1 Tax=Qipengyuania marisflavi TaxID=2486356 RepID=A0A5S3P7G3_9SPHN|nr:folate-binding protein [Qipengyuania marisflavi]TMM48972.1 folate-binding protein [Qipengyuania marisflavi]